MNTWSLECTKSALIDSVWALWRYYVFIVMSLYSMKHVENMYVFAISLCFLKAIDRRSAGHVFFSFAFCGDHFNVMVV